MKVWQIKDRPSSLFLSEEEVIEAILNGLIGPDDILVSKEYNFEVKIKDCIYAHYLKEDKDEKDEI